MATLKDKNREYKQLGHVGHVHSSWQTVQQDQVVLLQEDSRSDEHQVEMA